jgi:hypothetical protein
MFSLLRLCVGVLLGALVAHAAIIGAVMAGGMGGPFAGFAVTSMVNGLTFAMQPTPPAPDALQQALFLVFGPFFSMAGASVVFTGITARMMKLGWVIPVAISALLSIATLLPRLDQPAVGAPPVSLADLLLAAAAGALGMLICRAIAGRGKRPKTEL